MKVRINTWYFFDDNGKKMEYTDKGDALLVANGKKVYEGFVEEETSTKDMWKDIIPEGATMEEIDQIIRNVVPKSKLRRMNAVKYDRDHTRQIKMKLNLKTDADILEKLDSVPNKQGYIKELIRKDISK